MDDVDTNQRVICVFRRRWTRITSIVNNDTKVIIRSRRCSSIHECQRTEVGGSRERPSVRRRRSLKMWSTILIAKDVRFPSSGCSWALRLSSAHRVSQKKKPCKMKGTRQWVGSASSGPSRSDDVSPIKQGFGRGGAAGRAAYVSYSSDIVDVCNDLLDKVAAQLDEEPCRDEWGIQLRDAETISQGLVHKATGPVATIWQGLEEDQGGERDVADLEEDEKSPRLTSIEHLQLEKSRFHYGEASRSCGLDWFFRLVQRVYNTQSK